MARVEDTLGDRVTKKQLKVQTNNLKKSLDNKRRRPTTYSVNLELQNRACCMPYALRCSKSALK